MDWTNWKDLAIFASPFVLLLLAGVAWVLLRKTLRTRHRMERQLRDDPDIDEWLVVFNWSRKVLYIPTIIVSLVAAGLMLFFPTDSRASSIIGGIWLAVFFCNLLVDEYEMSVKVLLIIVLCCMVLALWLTALGWLVAFLKWFRHLGIQINASGYFILAMIFLLAMAVSWLKGLFYYLAITPNCLHIQSGPTETGEQISREEYSTRIDTGDFLERLLSFGRIVITFSDHRRQPLMLLVGRIAFKAKRLESLRSKLAIDRKQGTGGESATV
jgi:hypothetical protein